MHLSDSIVFAFRETFKWSNIKFALINAFIITIFWGFIGYFLWDFLMSASSMIVEVFPFSMVRSDGAWIISAIVFFQIVLITFAILMAFFGEFFLKKNREKYTLYTIYTFLASAILWSVIWFFKGELLYNEVIKVLMWFPFQTLEKGIAAFVAFYIIYNAIIVTTLFTTSIFSEKIILHSFDKSEVNEKNKFASIAYTIKDSIIFFIASILLFIVLFIPVLNILVQILLWVWLIKDTTATDALYLLYGEDKRDLKKSNKKAIYTISFVAVLFNFLPIIYAFAPVFAKIAMFKYFKNIKESK